jgi:hypothetical protein
VPSGPTRTAFVNVEPTSRQSRSGMSPGAYAATTAA